MQAFAHMMAQSQQQTIEMVSGLQRQFQDSMQGLVTPMKGEGKRRASGDGAKGTVKPIMSKGE